MQTDSSFPTLLPASILKGSPVKNLEGEDLGKIEELMIDQANGRVAYVVVSFGGILGVGDKMFAIPWDMLYLNIKNEVLVPNMDKETLENAPSLEQVLSLESAPNSDKDRQPNTNDHIWLVDIYSDYRYRPY